MAAHQISSLPLLYLVSVLCFALKGFPVSLITLTCACGRGLKDKMDVIPVALALPEAITGADYEHIIPEDTGA